MADEKLVRHDFMRNKMENFIDLTGDSDEDEIDKNAADDLGSIDYR